MNPPYLEPFVLTTDPAKRERHGQVDLYLPEADEPRPAVVFVHGGPVRPDLTPTPREWPIFTGYGNSVAQRGFVGVTVDHRLHDVTAYATAADDVAAAVEFARQDPRVDGDRVALWFFSGGSPLISDWLREPPSWLRALGATYPLLGPWPDVEMDPRFFADEAVAGAGELPIILTRVGKEFPALVPSQEAFVAAAEKHNARLEIIDVPDGQHGFDQLDHTEQSRKAVERAIDSVLATLE